MKHLHEKAIERTPKLLKDCLEYLQTLPPDVKKSKLISRIIRQIDVLEGKLIN